MGVELRAEEDESFWICCSFVKDYGSMLLLIVPCKELASDNFSVDDRVEPLSVE